MINNTAEKEKEISITILILKRSLRLLLKLSLSVGSGNVEKVVSFRAGTAVTLRSRHFSNTFRAEFLDSNFFHLTIINIKYEQNNCT